MNMKKRGAMGKAVFAAVVVAGMASCGAVELSTGWTADGEPVVLPHTWNAIDAADGIGRASNSSGATSYVRKVVAYRRALPDPKSGKRYFLKCAGAAVKTETFVNGKPVGRHVGAFTAFCHELTSALKPTGNEVEMRVDSRFDKNVQPIHADFSVYGGIYRVPELIETDPVCIDRVTDGAGGVTIEADAKTGDVVAHVRVLGGTNEVRRFHFDSPKLWSPETPNLYTVNVEVRQKGSFDSERVRFGFRTAEFREDGFYLNGVKRKLRGVNRHQDREGRGWCRSRDDEAEDVRWIKRMGADAVRTSHYPQSPAFYDLCDEAGILVWTEVPNVNGITFTETARQNELNEAREMVAQHRNHPSIFVWGIFNELYNKKMSESPEPRMCALRDYVKSLDPSRPVTSASNKVGRKDLNAITDVVGFNLYPGWYGRRKSVEMDAVLRGVAAKNPVRRTFAVSEYGCSGCISQHADAKFREPSTRSPFHPEEYQAYHHWGNYRAIAADPHVWGSFAWVMFDVGADARREGARFGINDKGLVTWDRSTAKDAYFFYKANWNPEPEVHIVGERMTETTNTCATVMVFSNVGTVTLAVNGRLIGTKEPDAVRTAMWEDVPLDEGANEIVATSGEFRRTARWVRRP